MHIDPTFRARMTGVTITMDDVMNAGHCASGCRRWFHEHGLDFHAFMKEGVDAAAFVEAGDDIARQIVERKLSAAKHG